MISTLKEAKEVGGNVSTGNSKMTDATSMATDSFACNTGEKLSKVEGTSCAICYARRLQTFRKNVDASWKRNQMIIERMIKTDAIDEWAEAVAYQINKKNLPKHRWFDGGDLCSPLHLLAIVTVAKLTPTVKHYLPTKEAGFVKQYIKRFGADTIPSNLMVRMSTPKIDGSLVTGLNGYTEQIKTSSVHIDNPTGFECPAKEQGNQCLSCDACWDSEVDNISYPKN